MPVTKKKNENETAIKDSGGNGSRRGGMAEEAADAHAEKERATAPSRPQHAVKKGRATRWLLPLLILGLVGASYVYKARLSALVSKDTAQTTQPAERKALYWVDPMHPAYKSDKPGKAPDCSMDLVPVYADEVSTAKTNLPEGAVQITAEKL